MAVDEIRIAVSPGEIRAVFLAGGRLVRYVVDRPGDARRLGDVVLGRVKRLVRGLDAAFVDIGERQDGFLATADAGPPGAGRRPIGRLLREGEAVVVEVIREAMPPKGAKLRVAADPGEATRPLGLRPPVPLVRGPDPVRRAVEMLATEACRLIVVDAPGIAAWLRNALPDLAERIQLTTIPGAAFNGSDVDEQLERLLRPSVPLPSGGGVTIVETPALVAIDVDSGATERDGASATALAVNLEAAEEVARQMALRGLAGQVVVDFMPMRRRDHRAAVLARLRTALTEAGIGEVEVAGYTRLGLVEMRRRRTGPTLTETLQRRCALCEGSGRVDSPVTVALAALRAALAADQVSPGRPLAIEAAAEVVAALDRDVADARAEAETRLGRPLLVRPAAGVPTPGFTITEVIGQRT